MQPLLGLVMIVKNEARGIVETLASVMPFVDRWTILDTGSTDGTQDLIRQHAGPDGQLFEEPFVDFATTRNCVLDLHGDATQFTIMLSGDDILVDGATLRAFLLARRDALTEIYNVERRLGSDRFMTAIVQRTGTGWRYVGRTHEVVTKPGCFATERVAGVSVMRRSDGAPEAKQARWELDLTLLTEDLARDPYDTRAAFYLAQTYECLGRFREALPVYERRIAMGGWREEVYEALFRSARVMDAIGSPWAAVQDRYLRAHAFDPTRAEPLYAIAKYWHVSDTHALTYLFASRAAALPVPNTMLFVDGAVYEHKAADLVAVSAYYLGQQLNDATITNTGKRAAEMVVRACPDDARVRKNRSFYVD